MLVVFSFKAKRGKEKEFENLLNNPDSGLHVAKAMGAVRNTMFLKNGKMIRILEFPEDVKPIPLRELAERDPKIEDFLRKIGPLIEDGFDYDNPESMEEFNKRNMFNLVYDVRV